MIAPIRAPRASAIVCRLMLTSSFISRPFAKPTHSASMRPPAGELGIDARPDHVVEVVVLLHDALHVAHHGRASARVAARTYIVRPSLSPILAPGQACTPIGGACSSGSISRTSSVMWSCETFVG